MVASNGPRAHLGHWYHGLLLTLFIVLWTGCSRSNGAATIVRNGDLTASSASSPQDWQPGPEPPGVSVYRWHHNEGAPGELEISNLKPNDSRWSQKIHLEPGWYQFTADIRTLDIPRGQLGANLSILSGSILTRPLYGTTRWQEVDLYVKVGAAADVLLTCRLGGFSSPNMGTAFFRNIRGLKIEEPPANAGSKFDLDLERGIRAPETSAVHQIIVLAAGAAALLGVALFLLSTFGLETRPSSIATFAKMPAALSWLGTGTHPRAAWNVTSLEGVLVVLGGSAFTLVFSYPILSKLSLIGSAWDWSEKLSHGWLTVQTIRHFHQAPLWDPYSCGGMPLLANPLFPGLTPWISLNLIFGPTVGMNLQIPIHLAIAWVGGYVLARCLGIGVIGGLTCASMFAASSWFFIQVAVGHFEMMATAYLPWILAFFWESIERRRLTLCLMAALLIAIAFGEGGIYVCARAALLVPLLAIYLAATKHDTWPLKVMMVLGIAAVGFSAIKLMPSAQLIRLHPRFIFEPEYNPVSTLLNAIFSRDQYWDHQHPPPGGFYEFGAYVSPIAAVMAAIGIFGYPRRSLPWLLCAALLFSLAIGSPRPWFPWALLRHLPAFASMRIPSISLQTGFILMVAMLAAFGADFIATYWKTYGLIVALALTLIATWDSWKVAMPNARVALMIEPVQIPPLVDFRQYFGRPFDMYRTALSNQGSVYCNESLDFSNLPENVIASNQPGYLGEQYLIGPGSIRLLKWTPNALTYSLDAEGNGPSSRIMVINQNYDSAWRVVGGGGEVFSEGGLIGVRVPQGKQQLELAYRNYYFYLGAIITFLTCVLSLFVWRCERRRRMVL